MRTCMHNEFGNRQREERSVSFSTACTAAGDREGLGVLRDLQGRCVPADRRDLAAATRSPSVVRNYRRGAL